jgi:hypothetical protein
MGSHTRNARGDHMTMPRRPWWSQGAAWRATVGRVPGPGCGRRTGRRRCAAPGQRRTDRRSRAPTGGDRELSVFAVATAAVHPRNRRSPCDPARIENVGTTEATPWRPEHPRLHVEPERITGCARPAPFTIAYGLSCVNVLRSWRWIMGVCGRPDEPLTNGGRRPRSSTTRGARCHPVLALPDRGAPWATSRRECCCRHGRGHTSCAAAQDP